MGIQVTGVREAGLGSGEEDREARGSFRDAYRFHMDVCWTVRHGGLGLGPGWE